MNRIRSRCKPFITMLTVIITSVPWDSIWSASGQPIRKPEADMFPKVPAIRRADVRDALCGGVASRQKVTELSKSTIGSTNTAAKPANGSLQKKESDTGDRDASNPRPFSDR